MALRRATAPEPALIDVPGRERVRRARAHHSKAASGFATWSTRSRVAVVLQLLGGADLHGVGQRYGIPAGELQRWRDAFLIGGEKQIDLLDRRVTPDKPRLVRK